MEKRKQAMFDVVVVQAARALSDGSRFQIRQDVVGEEDDVRRLLARLAMMCGANVRASQFSGLLTLYTDDLDSGTSVVVATVEK